MPNMTTGVLLTTTTTTIMNQHIFRLLKEGSIGYK